MDGHAWTVDRFAADHPAAAQPDPLTLVDDQGILAVTADRAWMIRRPRGDDDGWVIDLAGQAGSDDAHLLHVAAADRLSALFATQQAALDALRAARDAQVRVGQVWRHADRGELVQVVSVEHYGPGPDGTVYVRSLERDDGWSPGDFRRTHVKVSDGF